MTITACLAAGAENLLKNPSFEEVESGYPAHWRQSVSPMEGAYARLDDTGGFEGSRCVALHNPRSYEKEPANNWSQNLVSDYIGMELTLSGSVKTTDVTEAALWLQCWQRDPARILRVFSTGDNSRLTGTKDWTTVTTRAKVPVGTDFLVVRCVLKGQGTAWFDGIALAATDEPPPKGKKPDTSDTSDRSDKSDKAKSAGSSALAGTEDSIKRLREANEALVETNRALRESNSVLSEQIKVLQLELQSLREQLRQAVPAPTAPAQEPTKENVPPLVPHGDDAEE
ncbi:MAG: hypothetical protein HY706_21490 [Candidatus Hydrogenedentes bacterium]|nr:hypothetical protein [Candidatus Hydrogenedentota bacterium]